MWYHVGASKFWIWEHFLFQIFGTRDAQPVDDDEADSQNAPPYHTLPNYVQSSQLAI
jgi:hypothetical protein